MEPAGGCGGHTDTRRPAVSTRRSSNQRHQRHVWGLPWAQTGAPKITRKCKILHFLSKQRKRQSRGLKERWTGPRSQWEVLHASSGGQPMARNRAVGKLGTVTDRLTWVACGTPHPITVWEFRRSQLPDGARHVQNTKATRARGVRSGRDDRGAIGTSPATVLRSPRSLCV